MQCELKNSEQVIEKHSALASMTHYIYYVFSSQQGCSINKRIATQSKNKIIFSISFV